MICVVEIVAGDYGDLEVHQLGDFEATCFVPLGWNWEFEHASNQLVQESLWPLGGRWDKEMVSVGWNLFRHNKDQTSVWLIKSNVMVSFMLIKLWFANTCHCISQFGG